MQEQTPQLSKKLVLLFGLFAFIGFLDAAYLTVVHFSDIPLLCGANSGCETVTTSVYSAIAGIPVALLGALYYIGLLFLTIFYLDRKNSTVMHLALRLSAIGLVASLYFVGLQLFVLKALCIYCMASAISSTTLFVIGLFGRRAALKTVVQ
ncbi:MAG: vitamin K epoxide reductase family protein [Candidatus Paceibacterota bacterium]